MRDDLEELKARILSGMDVVEFLDFLNIEFVDVVERFEDVIEEEYERLHRELR